MPDRIELTFTQVTLTKTCLTWLQGREVVVKVMERELFSQKVHKWSDLPGKHKRRQLHEVLKQPFVFLSPELKMKFDDKTIAVE